MKKHLLSLSIISSTLLISMSINATQTTADLKVKGRLIVPTCNILPVNDGVYDFEDISSSLIAPTTEISLAPKSQLWTITCDTETYLNLTPIDNQAASSSDTASYKFGLGGVNNTGKIGYFTVVLKNALVNGNEARLFTTNTLAILPTETAKLDTQRKTGWASMTSNTQASGTDFVADFEVTPTLASQATMNGPITDNVYLDGSLTLNFAFGI